TRIEPATRAAAGDELVDTLRSLIRIPSVNPVPADPADGETGAARWIAGALDAAGLRPEVLEIVPGRGSVAARLRGDGTGGEPLLLLSHLDVVPAPDELWTHGPFDGDLAEGCVWGRGALDMKDLLAQELTVVRMLAAEARAAGRDPASDPIPGLTRDVLFLSTADEEAGGLNGIAWIVQDHPELVRAAGAVNEAGAVATTFAGRRFYPIGVAEKGYSVYRLTIGGTWGHGSMPHGENAAVRAAEVVTRLAAPGAPRLTPVMQTFLDRVAAALPADEARLVRALASGETRLSDTALGALCEPMAARAISAVLRDTVNPTVVRAGVKYNVIPGEAVVEVDCRTLPGTTEDDIREIVLGRLGELAQHVAIELVINAPAVEAPADGDLYELLERTIVDHDPDGLPVPFLVPYATDAKHLALVDVPAYGFSPLRLDPGAPYLELWHGVDERVSVDALKWGLPVLYDVVRRFCG
ncbi:MAG TPA: M20/M25/M40 family metallo-hydrolase, partial [Candidatus Limnocylindrales bacterium]|nr:M20/M25/M40 family metallo-hydrolase [Candidatus Limnocylindrales bacterium]